MGWGNSEKFSKKFRKIPRRFGKFPGIFRKDVTWMLHIKSDIVKRKIKIFTNGLQKKNPEFMLDSLLEYLRKIKMHQIGRVLPTTFIYIPKLHQTIQNKILSIKNIVMIK